MFPIGRGKDAQDPWALHSTYCMKPSVLSPSVSSSLKNLLLTNNIYLTIYIGKPPPTILLVWQKLERYSVSGYLSEVETITEGVVYGLGCC